MKVRIFRAMLIMGILIPTFVIPGIASAADKWFKCSVFFAGCSDQGAEIKLKRVSDNKAKLFFASAGEEDRMLAIALTAMNSGLSVRALVNWNQSVHNTILALRLLSN